MANLDIHYLKTRKLQAKIEKDYYRDFVDGRETIFTVNTSSQSFYNNELENKPQEKKLFFSQKFVVKGTGTDYNELLRNLSFEIKGGYSVEIPKRYVKEVKRTKSNDGKFIIIVAENAIDDTINLGCIGGLFDIKNKNINDIIGVTNQMYRNKISVWSGYQFFVNNNSYGKLSAMQCQNYNYLEQTINDFLEGIRINVKEFLNQDIVRRFIGHGGYVNFPADIMSDKVGIEFVNEEQRKKTLLHPIFAGASGTFMRYGLKYSFKPPHENVRKNSHFIKTLRKQAN